MKKYYLPKFIISKLHALLHFLFYYTAIGFGIGFAPYMPGTLGTLLIGVPSYVLISYLTISNHLIIVLVGILLGIWICALAEKILKKTDHPAIVWDEVCGYWITMLGVPRSIEWIILGFVAFRCFDILKPWPISRVQEQIKGGLGIMLDDILAGLCASVTLHLCLMK